MGRLTVVDFEADFGYLLQKLGNQSSLYSYACIYIDKYYVHCKEACLERLIELKEEINEHHRS